MRQLTIPGLLVVAGLAPAAPRPKEPPKNDAAIVGSWRLVSVNGTPAKGFSHIETFLEDGTRVRRIQIGKNEPDEYRTRYKTDTTAEPARIDFRYDRRPEPDVGIFKIDGDTLTICFTVFPNQRPQLFGPEVREGSLMVYQRVKPKE